MTLGVGNGVNREDASKMIEQRNLRKINVKDVLCKNKLNILCLFSLVIVFFRNPALLLLRTSIIYVEMIFILKRKQQSFL